MISLIAAIGTQNQLGLNNKLPWHIPEDLALFKKLTLNETIIMGRKTFDSIGRILPKRHHVIITSQADLYQQINVEIWPDLLSNINKIKKAFIIGGASVYQQALPFCQQMHITRVNYSGLADTYFPFVDFEQWNLLKREKYDNFVYEHWIKKDLL